MAGSGSIIARDDTLLGVCFAIGEDFGFNPLFLRIPLSTIVLWSPTAAVAVYAFLGTLVAISRWLAPNPVSGEAVPADSSECPDSPCEDLRLAA